jgi:dTDP-4-dehydrorhamnose 3,5-epimerase-like enzyme
MRQLNTDLKCETLPTINDIKLIQFPQLGDERGQLVVIEGETAIPFEIKRVFYIYGTDPKVVRGQHANRVTDFVMIGVSGTSKVRAVDGNGVQHVVNLDKPCRGVYLPHMIWKDMYEFSLDSVLLVLASTHYDASEYLRKYDEFLRVAREEFHG